MRHVVAALALILSDTPALRADITGEINSLSVTNTSSFIFASDALNGSEGYDRNAIHVETSIEFTEDGPSLDYHYQLRYQLLDAAGTPVLLKVGGGTADHVAVNQNVTGSTGNQIDTANLVPASQLIRGASYRAKMTLWRKPLGSIIPFADTGEFEEQDPGRAWGQFTNVISGDAPFNVLPLVQSATWAQPWAVDGSGDQDSFKLDAAWTAARYDGYAAAPVTDDITFRLSVELRRQSDNALVPLEQSSFDVVEPMQSYVAVAFPGQPDRQHEITRMTTLSLKPVEILPSSSETYVATVRIGHFSEPGADLPTAGNAVPVELPTQRLMHFNGTIRFGDINGEFSSVGSPSPVAGAPIPAGLPVTGLRINDQSGTLAALPGYTFGSGSPLAVTLEDDGDALLSAGSVNVVTPPDDFVPAGNMRYERKNIVLTPGGASADIALLLPAGLGWTSDPIATRVWESDLVFAGHPLTAGFGLSSATLDLKGLQDWFAEESKPVWFEVNEIEWDVAQSRLTLATSGEAEFVRGAELQQLLGDTDVPPGERTKRSNDHLFQSVDGISATVIVDADSVGTAKLTADFNFVGGGFSTHFPYGARVGWNGNGLMKVTQDTVDTAQSSLANPTNFTGVPYAQDCDDDSCPGANLPKKFLSLSPNGQPIRFTRTGGISVEGTVAANEKLQWGYIASLDKYAHETSAMDASRLHVPGGFSQQILGISSAALPASILHSGYDPSDGSIVRPGTVKFENGVGDYAGLNFRTASGSFTGNSVLAGSPAGPYDLSSRCQYIARYAGISGIHEANTGSFPESALLSGYPVQFEDFGIQLVHSEVTDTRTKGSLSLPDPAGFSLTYDKMFFTCLGAPSALEIDPAETSTDKVLNYWQADFRAKTIGFVPIAGMGCDPSAIRLSVAVEAWSSEIPDPLYGTLGFLPNGQIHTLADPATDPPINSRLTLPPNLVLPGPGDEQWAVSTVGDAYFNHAAAAPGDVGWLNIAAKLDLPFFEDSPVHLHTGCKKDDPNALLYLAGGFRNPAQSFSTGGANYFNEQPFDTGHRGYADGVSVTEYREGLGGDDDKFQMHAQTRWLDVVDLDYSMRWEPGSRTFSEYKDTNNTSLFILSLDHRCHRLTPQNADLDFGASAGLQKLSLTELASGQVSELFDTLQGMFEEEVFTEGRAAIEELLEPTMRDLFAAPIDVKLNAAADKVIEALMTEYWDEPTKSFKPLDKDILQGLLEAEDLEGAFQDIIGEDVDVAGLLQEVKDRLTKAKAHIVDFRQYSEPGPDNKFDNIATTAKRLAKKASEKLDNPAYSEDIDTLIAKAKPILTELDTLAEKAEDTCTALLEALEGKNDTFATELKNALAEAEGELSTAVTDVARDFNTLLKPFRDGIDDPFQPAERAELTAKLREAMADQFFSTSVSASVQNILKQRVYDVEQQMRHVVDGVFEQADGAARDIIATVLGGADKKLTEFLGEAAGVMAGAEVKGKAHIRGESLTDLRLDLKVELNVSDKMKAHVFVEIKELNSSNTPGGCLPEGGMGTEVTMGAEEVALEWIYPDTAASFNTKFQFDSEGMLTGLGGALEVTGELSFADQFVINEMGCAIMIGKKEFYISAEVGLTANGISGKGGIFFGRSCSLDPFFWDPTIEAALGDAPFTGAYAYGEAHVPLNQILGIPSSCLLNLTAGMGQGIGLFAEGPTGVGKIFYALSGEVLCIASVRGEVSLTGVLSLADFSPTLVGQGVLSGEIGYCPLCLDFEKTLTLTFKDWKLSYDLD